MDRCADLDHFVIRRPQHLWRERYRESWRSGILNRNGDHVLINVAAGIAHRESDAMRALGQHYFRSDTLRVSGGPCPRILDEVIIRITRLRSIQLNFRSIRTHALDKLIGTRVRHRRAVHGIKALDQAGRLQAEVWIGWAMSLIRTSPESFQVAQESDAVCRFSVRPDAFCRLRSGRPRSVRAIATLRAGSHPHAQRNSSKRTAVADDFAVAILIPADAIARLATRRREIQLVGPSSRVRAALQEPAGLRRHRDLSLRGGSAGRT